MANGGDHRQTGYSRLLSDFPELSQDCRVVVDDVMDRDLALAGGHDKPVLLQPLQKLLSGTSAWSDCYRKMGCE